MLLQDGRPTFHDCLSWPVGERRHLLLGLSGSSLLLSNRQCGFDDLCVISRMSKLPSGISFSAKPPPVRAKSRPYLPSPQAGHRMDLCKPYIKAACYRKDQGLLTSTNTKMLWYAGQPVAELNQACMIPGNLLIYLRPRLKATRRGYM